MYDNLLYEAYGYSLGESDYTRTQELKRAFMSSKTWEDGQRYISSIRSSIEARKQATQLVALTLGERYHKMVTKHFNNLTFKDELVKVLSVVLPVKEKRIPKEGYVGIDIPVSRDGLKYLYKGFVRIYFPYDNLDDPILWSTSGPSLSTWRRFKKDAKAFFSRNFPNWKEGPKPIRSKFLRNYPDT